jgi:arylsulfatase A-like enzyme
MKKFRRFTPGLAAAGFLLFAFPGSSLSAAAADRKPNILIIVADDLGYGELSCQGNPQIPTPAIDSLAREGVRFTSGYVSGPYCSPTRAGLMTGRYQERFGHEFNPGPAQSAPVEFGLSLKEKTIGNRFKELGYATGWFGKSHLGYLPQYHPLKRGFDEYYGFLGGAHDYLDAAADGHNPILRGTNRVSEVGYTTEAFGKEAVGFIEKHRSESWLCYLAFNAVHAPLESTEKYLSRFANIADRKRHTFAAMLSAMDDAVASVLATLRRYHLEENTLIFFFSDNGGPTRQTTSGNAPLRGFKAQTWEGGVRVPWIVQWKGHIQGGKVDDRPVIQLDILPTALAAAGVTAKPAWKLDGVNLLPCLTGKNSAPPHEALFWRFGGQMAIRKGDWKLVKGPGLSAGEEVLTQPTTLSGAELYNLTTDIGEKNNLADVQKDKVNELSADWERWNAELVPPAWGGRKGSQTAVARTQTRLNSTASAQGPWKLGDSLNHADAPQVADRPFSLSAQVEATGLNGVIIAQGGTAHGYTLYLEDGKPAFALREAHQLSTIKGAEALGPGSHKVEARLEKNARLTLLVDGKTVASGQAPRLIAKQPVRGLTIGSDEVPIGEYTSPNPFPGKIEGAQIRFD